jgi:hypothetical protein
MVSLMSLLFPIIGSAVLVFVVSSVIHMVFTYHKDDLRRLPNEDAARAAMRPLAIPPGDYAVPFAGSAGAMKDPAYNAKLAEGPVAVMTVYPNGPFAMGRSLVLWFIYSLVVSLFAGYLASRTLAADATYLMVFRVTGTVAFTGYALGLAQQSIWYNKNWGATLRSMFDGLIYAMVTAGTFGWRWPS